ncbi:MAG TPA: hypothetical protein V6D08_01910 [Candidatus Obscuribacterales bacterium]
MTDKAGDRTSKDVGSSEPAALERLRQEIELHRKNESSRSYLSRAIGALYGKDDTALEKLEKLSEQADKAKQSGDAAALSRLAKEAETEVSKHREALATEQEIRHYACGFLKTAALFMRGRIGLAGTIGLYALDQMNPSDRLSVQLLDGTMGGAKGGLLKGALHIMGTRNVSVPLKGVGLGVTSRVLETGLTRSTHLDPGSGEFSLGSGLGTLANTALNRKALLADALIFSVAHGLLKGADRLTLGKIESSAFLKTALTGTTFGMSSGAASEIMRQQAAGESFDFGKVARRALIQGALDTVAAAPGGIQARNLQTRIASERLAAEKALADKLAAEKPAADRAASDKPAAEKPAADKRVAEILAQELAAQERSARQAAKAEKARQRKERRQEAERKQKEEQAEQERINRQRKEQERKERQAAEKARKAQEEAAREQARREQKERIKQQQEKKEAERLAAHEKAQQEKLAAEKAAQEKLLSERQAWESKKRPAGEVWREVQQQLAGAARLRPAQETRGDKAQRELFDWAVTEQAPRGGDSGGTLELMRLRREVQQQMGRDGWVLVETAKSSLADGAGMDYILANTRDGRYRFIDATLDPMSKAGLPELRRNSVIVIALDEIKSPTNATKAEFLKLLKQMMAEPTPLNLSDTPPPRLSGALAPEQAKAELARFRASLVEKVKWMEFDAGQQEHSGQHRQGLSLREGARALDDYNTDLSRVGVFRRMEADKAADPNYESDLAAFGQRVAQTARQVLKHYFAKGEVMRTPFEPASGALTVSDKQGRRFVYVLADERLYFETAGGGMRYEVKRIADLMDRVLSAAEVDAFRNGASKNARGFDRYELKRSLSSHRSPERLTVMQRLLDRLSAESTESLLGR